MLWYICILFVQPQNRFLFLYPLHIADIAVIGSLSFHVFSALTENKPLIRFGPATITAFFLIIGGYISLHMGAFQTSSAWNGYIDRLMKGALVVIMIEATTISVQRIWAVYATILLSTMWWIKGGLRLSLSGATFAGDRVMGPGVSIIENPNGFAYMMCVMIPVYLYFYQQSSQKYLRILFLAIALSAVYIVFQTGSRTGTIILIVMALFLLPKYGSQHKGALIGGAIAIFLIFSVVSPGNIRRLKSIPKSIVAALSGEVKEASQLDQDQQSAQERTLKNRHTWGLIKEHLMFGVGISPNESLFGDEFPYARGQVHCEILMAGRQMGLIGMGLYISLVTIIFGNGRKIQRAMAHTWPAISDMGWTLKIQAVTIMVGGFFSPLPWNVVTLVLAGVASSLSSNLRRIEMM